LEKIKGKKTKFNLYTVPGQVYYAYSRKVILNGVDGVVFVADSQFDRLEANLETLNDLENNLRQDGHKLNEFPWVIQYNKRDLPNVAPIQYLQLKLNKFNVPYFEAVSTQGNGVFETLKAVINLVVANVRKKIIRASYQSLWFLRVSSSAMVRCASRQSSMRSSDRNQR
jgi:signal recognition particle receptor subunit beta